MLKVWMSHGDKVVEMPPGFKLMASTEACPIAGMADEARRFYGVQFHPEVTHTRQGTSSCTASCARSAAAAATGTCPTMSPSPCARIRETGRAGGSHPRAFGRRRFLGRRRAHPQGDRRAAHLRVRRPRPAAPERSEAGDGHLRQAHAREGRCTSTPPAEFSERAERRRRPGGEAQDHRAPVRRGVPARSEEDAQREVARAGHDLSRRDRVGRARRPRRR